MFRTVVSLTPARAWVFFFIAGQVQHPLRFFQGPASPALLSRFSIRCDFVKVRHPMRFCELPSACFFPRVERFALVDVFFSMFAKIRGRRKKVRLAQGLNPGPTPSLVYVEPRSLPGGGIYNIKRVVGASLGDMRHVTG